MLRGLFFSRKREPSTFQRPNSGPGGLPVEIYQCVFRHLIHSHATLLRLRIVSTSFKREVEPFIRIKLFVDRGSIKNRVHHFRQTIKFRGIARLIRSFQFSGAHDGLGFNERSSQAQEYWELLRDALGCMEQLEHLVLIRISGSWEDWQTWSRQPINLLDGCSFTKLSSVHLDAAFYRDAYPPLLQAISVITS